MIIETLQDWNAAAGCCCPMPSCPTPTINCESISATYRPQAQAYSEGVYYKTRVVKYWYYEDGGSGPFHEAEEFTESTRGWNLAAGPCGETDYEETSSWFPPEGSYITAVEEVSLSNPFSEEEFLEDTSAHFESYSFPSECAGGQCAAKITGTFHPSLDWPVFTKVRYRWRIPSSHLGSYFKITWDVVTEPDEGEATLATLTWVWSGPGDTENAEDSSWFSGWYDLSLPEEKGEKRVVNIRFECYKSTRMGTRPEITGEGWPA